MSLSLYEFNTLSNEEKKDTVFNNGDLLVGINTIKTIETLHSYSNFYVEIIRSNKNLDLIELTAFKKGTRLDKYLDTITLPGH